MNVQITAAARASLTQWLERIRAKGYYTDLFEIKGYGFLIVYGPPDAVPQLLEYGIRALQTVKSLPAPPPIPALPMPKEENEENDGEFPGLDPNCAAALRAANIGRGQVMRMSKAQLRKIAGLSKKRAELVHQWLGATNE